ncbi:MAG: hypothetical protein JNM56_19875 [Planctomycetia bacterium]|nr:hypothetical protein [Planctomycetia bacterium]
MSHRITCPHCAAPLRLPEGLAAPFGLCPRCQGQVPNPGAPQGEATETGITTSAFARPVFAFDEELGPEPPRSNRRLVYCLLLLFLAVFLAGGISGLLATSSGRGFDGLNFALAGLVITLGVFGAAFLPLLLIWLMRARFLRRAAPDGYGRVVLLTLFWILLSTLSGVAAFVLFFVACLGGLTVGS